MSAFTERYNCCPDYQVESCFCISQKLQSWLLFFLNLLSLLQRGFVDDEISFGNGCGSLSASRALSHTA